MTAPKLTAEELDGLRKNAAHSPHWLQLLDEHAEMRDRLSLYERATHMGAWINKNFTPPPSWGASTSVLVCDGERTVEGPMCASPEGALRALFAELAGKTNDG
jgi:hypothetical protein